LNHKPTPLYTQYKTLNNLISLATRLQGITGTSQSQREEKDKLREKMQKTGKDRPNASRSAKANLTNRPQRMGSTS
jgi:hypothetical protein